MPRHNIGCLFIFKIVWSSFVTSMVAMNCLVHLKAAAGTVKKVGELNSRVAELSKQQTKFTNDS